MGVSNLDEDERLTRQGWVEEAEAAPVGCKAAVQVFPALDLVLATATHVIFGQFLYGTVATAATVALQIDPAAKASRPVFRPCA
jgi:hypothetical protein